MQITPEVFDDWMTILQRTYSQHTILWLMIEENESRDRIIREAGARGVHSSRLWFTDRADRTE